MRRFHVLASVATLVPALVLGGCSSATIERIGAPNLEAPIAGSDDKNVYVLSDDGQTFAVPRRTIRDIDHPGNVLLTVGACLLGMTALVYVSSGSSDRAGSSVFGAMGAPMFIGGLIPWLQSTRAAGNTDPGGYEEQGGRPPRRDPTAPRPDLTPSDESGGQ